MVGEDDVQFIPVLNREHDVTHVCNLALIEARHIFTRHVYDNHGYGGLRH